MLKLALHESITFDKILDLKKILIIRFSSIGDIVLTTPVIRCLKEQLNNAEIHYLTKTEYLPILKTNPFVDKVYAIDQRIHECIEELKSENYDHIIDLHKNVRSKKVLLKLKRPSSTFRKLNVKKWLIVNLKLNRLPSIHIVDRYFQSLKSFNISNDQKGLDFFIPAEDTIDKNSLPKMFHNTYIGWVIGGKHNTKIYPEEKIIDICKRINKPVVILGGPEDSQKGERIKSTLGNHIFNACGKYNLNQSASLLGQAEIIITNDTGLMHIAAALKKDIISLWGSTIPEFGMYPYMPQEESKSKILEVKNLSCRPCSKLGFKKCPKKHFDCMKKIDIKDVIRLIG